MSIPGIIICFKDPELNIFSGMNKLMQLFVMLMTGIIHNPPTWYIPLICIFFLCAKFFLKLESKSMLYKLIPILLIFTIFLPRPQWDTCGEINTAYLYSHFYLIYLSVMLIVFLHFCSFYVIGMYFSAKKKFINILYQYRWIILSLTIVTAIADVSAIKYNLPQNGDISKLFLSLAIFGFLRHYDLKIKNFKFCNKICNTLARYSFGIFFVHWYILMLFNKMFLFPAFSHVSNFSSLVINFLTMGFRFIFVFCLSLIICYIIKHLLKHLGVKNTRTVIGV